MEKSRHVSILGKDYVLGIRPHHGVRARRRVLLQD